MGFFSSKSLGSLAGGAIGAFFGGPSGATVGAGIGSSLMGGDDDLTALQAYQMQRADSLADWNRQNAYNDPSAQMARLQKAGLNPYLVYNGNVTGNSSTSIDSPTYRPSNAQPVSTQLTKALQNLNYRSMKADTRGKEVDTEMRELDLALKKARLAKLSTGGFGNVLHKPKTASQINAERKLAQAMWEEENPVYAGAEKANFLGIKPGRWMSSLVEKLSSGLIPVADRLYRNGQWF